MHLRARHQDMSVEEHEAGLEIQTMQLENHVTAL